MASIISAGTTSATALNMSADTTGVLQLASNNGTVALTIDTSQNIGVNSTGTVRTKLMVSSSNASDVLTVGTASGGFSITNSNNAYGLQFGSLSTGNSWIQSARLDGTATAYDLLLQPGGGGVAIGSSSTVGKLTLENSATTVELTLRSAGGVGTNNRARIIGGYQSGGSDYGGYLAFNITSTSNANAEAARFDAGGTLLVNFTSNPYQGENTRLAVQGGETPLWVQGTQQGYCQGSIAIASGTADSPSGRGLGTYLWNRGTTATWFMGTAYSASNSWFVMRQTGANFRADTADVGLGWLMQLTSSGVAYQGNNSSTWTTSSDARIKDDVQAIENGLEIVLALRPVEFYNKITKKREENFIAQEYEQVLAKHVTREEPVGVEAEFVTDEILRLNPNLVPYLVSAIQKQQAIIEQLKADVAVLKGTA